jgi:hypothetical protein
MTEDHPSPSGEVGDYGSPELPEAVTSVADGSLADAGLKLARRTLEYVGWLDGTFDKSGAMDADADLKNLALEVYAERGIEPPARVHRTKGKKP